MSLGALIEKFRSVGLERIEKMNLTLVGLERDPNDDLAREEILREAHTLKGEAKMMGFADVNLVAHQTEHLLLLLTSRNFEVSKDVIDLVFEGLDLIRSLLTKSSGAGDEPVDLSSFIERVAVARMQLQGSLDAPAQGPVPAAAESGADSPSSSPVPTGEPDQAAPHPSHDAPSGPASEFQRSPTGGWVRPGAGRSTKTRIQALDQDSEVDDSAPGGRPQAMSTMLRIQTGSTLRVDLDKLERLGDVAGEVLLMSRRFGHRLGDVEDIRGEFRGWLSQAEGHLPKSQLATVRTLIHRLDAFETAAREEAYLVSMRSGQLDEQTRRLRHVPLAEVLSHYPRAVRDLANSQGKRVRLVHEFGSVEVDRAILSAMSDPLLHLVRNAVDHGIESPEERAELGKEPEGEIRLSAEYAGDSIRVVLADDGRGIDTDFILRRAVERGTVTEEEAASMTDQDALALIFEPGFTTTRVVTDISGRGIGMDIVRRQITSLGGFIEIESEVGQGTSFMLHLPVSSAVSSMLMFAIADQCFGLPAKEVERVDTITSADLRRAHGGVCLRYEDELIPLVDWAPLLSLSRTSRPPARFTVLLVRKGTRKVAVWVDEVIGEREAINRPLGDFLNGVRLCRGVALTDAAEVVPLLNLVDLLAHSTADQRFNPEGTSNKRSWTAIEGNRAVSIKTILVVEDSEVTRALVTGILRGLGYRILEADDGQRGFEMLDRHKIDLVLSDVQMPRMDGLEMLRAIRGSERHADLPVIMLSTLGEAEDKARAMSLGANGYLVKLDFQEKELINTVRRYL